MPTITWAYLKNTTDRLARCTSTNLFVKNAICAQHKRSTVRWSMPLFRTCVRVVRSKVPGENQIGWVWVPGSPLTRVEQGRWIDNPTKPVEKGPYSEAKTYIVQRTPSTAEACRPWRLLSWTWMPALLRIRPNSPSLRHWDMGDGRSPLDVRVGFPMNWVKLRVASVLPAFSSGRFNQVAHQTGRRHKWSVHLNKRSA